MKNSQTQLNYIDITQDGYSSLTNDFKFENAIVYESIKFYAVENALKYAKYFGNNPENETFLETCKNYQNTANDLRVLEKQLKSKLVRNPKWDKNKLDIVENLIEQKFENNSDLKKQLIATGNLDLVEITKAYDKYNFPWADTFWGMYLPQEYFDNPVGENHLGKILMKIRNKII